MVVSTKKAMAIYWGRRGGGLALYRQFVEGCRDQGIPILESLRPSRTMKNGFKTSISNLNFFSWINARKNVLSSALNQGVDTVIFIMASPWDIFLGKKLIAAGINVVRIIHDGSPHPGEYFPSKFWIRWLTRDCSQTVTLSKFVANQLNFNFGLDPNSIKVCEFPVPKFKIPEVSKDKKNKKVLLIGRGKKYQGQSLLEQAWDLINVPGTTLVIAGEGFIERRKQANIEYKKHWMTDEEIIYEIASSHLVVFPYLEASQSGTIPICKYLGIPVIVTPVGGLPEQVNHGIDGIVLSEISAEEIALAIISVLSDRIEFAGVGQPNSGLTLIKGCLTK